MSIKVKRVVCTCAYCENKHFEYSGVFYGSKQEAVVAEKFVSSLSFIGIDRETTHIIVGSKEYDFLLNTTFVDYHPWDWYGKTTEQYYNERRQILNANGYSSYEYVVLKSMKEVDEFVTKRLQE